jgi:membrane associated rhomboid family serine protease
MGILLFLAILAVLGYRATTPEQREELLRAAVRALRQLKAVLDRSRQECEPFYEALQARSRRTYVTAALAALNAAVFVCMVFGAGALRETSTLMTWGGNFAPRTTNGEWWRLLTSAFVHTGFFPVLINLATLVQLGLIVERLVGRLAFAAVYIAAAIFASLVHLAHYPLTVSVGASGAIFSLYGLLLASWIWSLFPRSSVTMPLVAAERLVPVSGLFILYNVANGNLGSAAELTGFGTGLVCGLVMARGVSEKPAPPRLVGAAMAATVVIAVASAFQLRSVTDVRPEIDRVVELEERTARTYQTEVDRFMKGRVEAAALVQLIDRTIVPELQAADARLKALERVPREQQPLVAEAEEYVRLRRESWRLRVEGLRRTHKLGLKGDGHTEETTMASWRVRTETEYRAAMVARGKADGAERTSLEAFEKVKLARRK